VDEPQLKFISGSVEHLYGHLSESDREAMRAVKVNPPTHVEEGQK